MRGRENFFFPFLIDSDGNAESNQTLFLENLTRIETFECLQQMLPFLQNRSLIVNSEYRLNTLDLMEILIALMSKELSIIKHTQILRDFEEKLKLESSKKSKKSVIRKK